MTSIQEILDKALVGKEVRVKPKSYFKVKRVRLSMYWQDDTVDISLYEDNIVPALHLDTDTEFEIRRVN
jgi:hypothetical protein